ncbi:splicing factor 45 isoform X2 [Schistocerca piceifrons]|uniref:splicing factor 45 isoform X2 n=1 Tax=Schistocerca piceifrons TaxID=274613 RepID=UPI001F5EDB31|nr:splicing factor 45 isoform X2 [Schistocerca piceifrons]
MSLYDDMDAIKQKSEQVAGWSSGIKLLQSQLQLKKAVQTQPRRDALRKSGQILAPVIDLKSKKDDEDSNSNSSFGSYSGKEGKGNNSSRDLDWNVEGEYDPMWPNDYEKVVKDLREIREREKEKEEEEKRRKNRDDRDKRGRDRYDNSDERRSKQTTGFAGRRDSDEEEEEKPTTPRVGGVAIAPPPSLQEPSPAPAAPPGADGQKLPQVSGEKYGLSFGGSVAAKIMAKYGFKEGQGLGKQEQGISMALQVEKTSKRGGRIISEKEIMPPPPPSAGSPSSASQSAPQGQPKPEPSITEIMKSPAKVVLLRNMVGPGEVDEDLEPEVKDECNTKYGDVVKVLIYEQPSAAHDEAVRIFVEFKRIESAIKVTAAEVAFYLTYRLMAATVGSPVAVRLHAHCR